MYAGFFFIQNWSSFHQMNAGKGYNSNPHSTKRLKLDRVDPVDNRPPNDKNGAPKQWCVGNRKGPGDLAGANKLNSELTSNILNN